jgi:DNA-binding response OmpR family regulator
LVTRSICDKGQGLSCSADVGDGLEAIRIEGVGQMAIEKRDLMFRSGRPSPPPGSSCRHEISVSGDAVMQFGRFCVLPRARQLLVDRQPVELGSRAFDLLMVLIGAPGTLVTKKEIFSCVWPGTVVEEANLKVQMSAVRKVLSRDRELIKTIHGRGYVFTGEVSKASVEPDALARPSPELTPPPLGRALTTNLSDLTSPHRQRTTGSKMIPPDDKARPTVTVIDDDPDIREALRGLLRTVGLRVELFASVQEFLDSSPSDLPGCLVLDVRLPGRSGLDFQAELPAQICACRLSSSAATPISRCRFAP